MFAQKGKPGYIRGKKIRYLLLTLLLAVLILALLLIGFFLKGDTKNIYTIMAVLTALPLANLLTVYIAMFPYTAPAKELYEEVRALTGNGLLSTELAVTSTTLKTMYFPFVYVHPNGVICYTEQKQMDLEKAQAYIEGMLAANRIQTHVKIFTDFRTYCKRLGELSSVDRNTCEETLLKTEGVLHSISL